MYLLTVWVILDHRVGITLGFENLEATCGALRAETRYNVTRDDAIFGQRCRFVTLLRVPRPAVHAA